MTQELDTPSILLALFGKKVGPAHLGIKCEIDLGRMASLSDDAIRTEFREVYQVTDLAIERNGPGRLTVVVPYMQADAYVKEIKSSGMSTHGNSIATALVDHFFGSNRNTMRIRIPCASVVLPEDELAARLTTEIRSYTPIETKPGALRVTLTQFQTLRNEWQKVAQHDQRLADLAAKEDSFDPENGPSRRPHGAANPDDDKGSMRGVYGAFKALGDARAKAGLRLDGKEFDDVNPPEEDTGTAPESSPKLTGGQENPVPAPKAEGGTPKPEVTGIDAPNVFRVAFGKPKGKAPGTPD